MSALFFTVHFQFSNHELYIKIFEILIMNYPFQRKYFKSDFEMAIEQHLIHSWHTFLLNNSLDVQLNRNLELLLIAL